MSNTLTGAIHDLSERVGVSLDHINDALRGGMPVPRAAASDPREEMIIRYTVGTGEWDEGMSYNVLRMKMFKMNGERDGHHDGVWKPVQPPSEIVKQPPNPQRPYDKPEGPVPNTKPRAQTKAIWVFGDEEESSITAVGPAELFLSKLVDGSQIFLVAVCAIMTSGTGKYEGAQGIKTALGSTFVPAGIDIFNMPVGTQFGAVTIETFRVIRKEFRA